MRCLLSLECQHKIKITLIYEVQDKTIHWLTNSRKPNNSRKHQLINLQTRQLTNSRKPNNHGKHQLINLQTRQLTNSQPRQTINSSAHKIIIPQAYQLTNPPTQNLKIIYFVLQNRSDFHFVLAKILTIK